MSCNQYKFDNSDTKQLNNFDNFQTDNSIK